MNKRNEIAKLYNSFFASTSIGFPQKLIEDCFSSYHLYVIKINKGRTTKSKKQIFHELIQKGLFVNLHYSPIYKQPFYKKFNFKDDDYKQAEEYANYAVSLPIYPSLNQNNLEYIFETLDETIC